MKTKITPDNMPSASTTASTQTPFDGKLKFADAFQFYQSGNLHLAEEICKQILNLCPAHAEALHLLGRITHQNGNPHKSLKLLRQAIEIDPDNPISHCSLGEILKDLGRWEESIVSYQKALALKPDFAEGHYDLGNIYHCQKIYSEAIACYQKALQIKPDFVEAFYNLGNTYLDQEEFGKAVSQYERTLILNPGYADAYFNLGIVLLELGRFDEAIAACQKTLTLKPDNVEAHYNMGIGFQAQRRLKEAIACYQKAVLLKPDFPQAYNNMGNAFQDLGDTNQAIACFQKALQFEPDYVEAHYNLAKSYHDQNRHADAVLCYQKVLQIAPGFYRACNNLAKTYQDMRQLEKAANFYGKALKLNPDYAEAHFNFATLNLLTGNFEAGWSGYEWRLKCRDWKRTYPYRYLTPRWNGENFVGRKLYVHSEQGFGDTIQFIRYLPLVKARGGSVIFETMGPLLGLLENFAVIDELVEPSTDGQPSVACELCAPLLSLPAILGTTLKTIPAEIPYLFSDLARASEWQKRLDAKGFKVGLVWAGKSSHDNDAARSCKLEDFAPLANIPEIQLYGLQKGKAAGQTAKLAAKMNFVNLGDQLENFADTAGVIANLDLVISVDTAAAHLAGAMGKPVWVLLPYVPDWRWFLDRHDSPWYPTMRLFRQEKHGDWVAVMRWVSAELQKVARGDNDSYPL